MVFDPRGFGDHRPVVIHNQTITQARSYKYRGVYIDESLTWSTHVDSLCCRLQQRLHVLRRLRIHGVDKENDVDILSGSRINSIVGSN